MSLTGIRKQILIWRILSRYSDGQPKDFFEVLAMIRLEYVTDFKKVKQMELLRNELVRNNILIQHGDQFVLGSSSNQPKIQKVISLTIWPLIIGIIVTISSALILRSCFGIN